MKQRVQALIGLKPNAAAVPSVASRRATARDKLFAPKGGDAVSAITGFDPDLCTVNKHYL
jgi:hypothetical protein